MTQYTAYPTQYLYPSRLSNIQFIHRWQAPVLSGGKTATSLFVLDEDGVVVDTTAYEREIYYPQLFALTDGLGLDRELVKQAHQLHLRKHIPGIEYLIPELVELQKLELDPRRVLWATRQFWNIMERERIPTFPHVRKTLPEIRRRFPRTAIVMFTLCPSWLAASRAGPSVLPHLDGIIAVHSEPGIRGTLRYSDSVAASSRCIEQFFAVLGEAPNIKLELSLPGNMTKPHRHGLDLACAWAGVRPQRAVFVGDSEVDRQTALAAGWPNFVLAAYGADPAELPSLRSSSRYAIDSFSEIVDVMEKLRFQDF